MRFTDLKYGYSDYVNLRGERRPVYLDRANYTDPLMSAEEEREDRRTKAVNMEKRGAEVYHGYHITDDQAVEAHRLGIREDLYDRYLRWFPNTPVQDLPVNDRINARVRSRAAEIVSERRRREGFLRSRWRAGRGFFQNLRSVFRTGSGLIEEEQRERYGNVPNVQNRRQYLSAQVWNNLTPAQQVLVNAQLGAMAVPMPGFVPVGMPPNVLRLAGLTRDQLVTLRTACNFLAPPEPGPLFPSRRDITPANHFQTLEEFVEIQGEERRKALATTVYDPQRLQNRLDRLETDNPPLFNMLVTEILEDNALFPAENNPPAQALLAYLEWRLDNTGGGGNLMAELTNIRDNLPVSQAGQNAEQTDNEREAARAAELANTVAQSYDQLLEKYIEAENLGAALYTARQTHAHTPQPATPASGAPAIDTGYDRTQQIVETYEKEARTMRNEINKLERKFGNTVREMLTTLNDLRAIPAAAGPNDPVNLIILNNSVFGLRPPGPPPPLPNLSDDDQLFGPTKYPPGGGVIAVGAAKVARPARGGATAPSAFMTGIQGLTPRQIAALNREASGYSSNLSHERVSCRQLLFLLKEGDLARRGITNAEQRGSHALLATNMMIADVQNEQMFRQTNQELAERQAGTTLGMHWLDRVRKRVTTGLTGGVLDNFLGTRIFKTRDLVDYIAGFDKDFAMFKGMSKDITLAELRDKIANSGGISSEKLFEFSSKLREVFMSFEMMGQEGRVEFFEDEAVDMETLIHNLLTVREELRSRKFFEEIRGQEGNKAELILRKIREDENAKNTEERSVLERVASQAAGWKQWFSRLVLDREFGDKYAEARKFMKEKGIKGKEARDYLSAQGLATAAGALATAYTAREWAQRGKSAARWAVRSGGTGLGLLWNKAGAPVLKYGVKKPLEWAVWRPAKWTAQTAGKVIAFPFVLAGSIAGGYWKWATGKSK